MFLIFKRDRRKKIDIGIAWHCGSRSCCQISPSPTCQHKSLNPPFLEGQVWRVWKKSCSILGHRYITKLSRKPAKAINLLNGEPMRWKMWRMHLGFGNWGQKLYLFEHDLVLFNYNRMYYFLTFRLNPLTFDNISTELQSACRVWYYLKSYLYII